MTCFGFEDCGPKLREALIRKFGHEDSAAREVAACKSPSLGMNSSRRHQLVIECRTLLIAASAACTEKGKELLAIVGDALIPHVSFAQDLALIPGILDEWTSIMDSFPTKA